MRMQQSANEVCVALRWEELRNRLSDGMFANSYTASHARVWAGWREACVVSIGDDGMTRFGVSPVPTTFGCGVVLYSLLHGTLHTYALIALVHTLGSRRRRIQISPLRTGSHHRGNECLLRAAYEAWRNGDETTLPIETSDQSCWTFSRISRLHQLVSYPGISTSIRSTFLPLIQASTLLRCN